MQSVLAANRDILAGRSIHYPALYRGEERHRGSHSIVAQSYRPDTDVRRHFAKRMPLASDCATLMLSAEGFPKAARFREFLPGFRSMFPAADLRFVFYVRRFDHWAESAHAQALKQLPAATVERNPPNPDFGKLIAPFADAFGPDAVIVRPYNRAHWPHRSLVSDMFAAIERDDVWPDLRIGNDDPVNAGLPRAAVYVLSMLDCPKAKSRFLAEFARDPAMLPADAARFFRSPDERRAFNEEYAARGQAVADRFGLGDIRNFLGLDDYDDDPDWVPFIPDEKTLDIVRRFS